MAMTTPLRLQTTLSHSCSYYHGHIEPTCSTKLKATNTKTSLSATQRNAASIHNITISSIPTDKKCKKDYLREELKILNKQQWRLKQAVDILYLKRHEDEGEVFPDSDTYISIIQRCINMKDLIQGIRVHVVMIKTGFNPGIYLENYLLTMYTKCGGLWFARQVFDKMRDRDQVSWTAMISGYARNGLGDEALWLFCEMQHAGIRPNEFTFVTILKVCTAIGALEEGKQIHGSIIKKELESNVYLGSALVDFYAKFGRLDEALYVFDKVNVRDDAMWSAIIKVYAQQGCGEEALRLFQQMQRAGMRPNKFCFCSILKVCASLVVDSPGIGRQVHAFVVKSGFDSNMYVGSGLVDMYAKCGSLDEASVVFDEMPERDVVSWTALMMGYEQHGYSEEALMLLHQLHKGGVKTDLFIMSTSLSACRNILAIRHGKCLHAHAIKSGMECDTHVATSLIHMYANCDNVDSAHRVYERMPKQDIVVSTSMLAVYSKHGHSKRAFGFLKQMQRAGIRLDQFACASVLSSCASISALEQGKQVHAWIVKNGFESEAITRTGLIDMYSKSGGIDEASKVFGESFEMDIVSWNAMIVGYSKHGFGKEALQLFEQIQKLGMMPDDVTFVGVLCACSQAGLVDEGRHCFDSMSRDHGISPKIEHYACMVDLLSHAGFLNEAYDLIKKMPFEADAAVWGALLAGCRDHGNMGLGRIAAGYLYELEPGNSGHYIALSNMYAASGRWFDVERVSKLVIKELGCSWIEVDNKLHTFLNGDKSHPQTKAIYTTLDILANHMKDTGYVCNTKFVSYDAEKKQKEHSEKLAIAFGLISTPPRTSIHIVKNLRMCDNCHNETKFISKIVEREIILRDINCVHRFQDGLCYCGD